jgi:spoIIIJ-associated protein
MQWVVTTGRTVEEAKEAALDQLGVDEAEADFEILEEPRRGIFGIGGTEARVRARVRPRIPRPKHGRRRRRNREEGDGDVVGDDQATSPGPAGPAEVGGGVVGQDLSEQASVAREFVDGLVRAFGLPATVTASVVDDETVTVAVDGPGVGVLIGPKGQTLNAIAELARTVVARRNPAGHARLVVDVGGYWQRRREALERFTRQLAADVLATRVPKAMEPMSPSDRKIVHDVVNTIPGVTTVSEGEEPRRRVVIVPEGA